jgi:hypothetical protein
MEKDPSPLDTLRQLKEWLDAGTITPQEFATLKQKLLFSETPGSPKPAAPAQPEAGETPPTQTILSEPTPARPPVSYSEPSALIAPIEEPLLPPVVHPHTAPVPAETPPTPTAPGFSQPMEVGRPAASATEQEQVAYAPAEEPVEEEVPIETYTAPSRSPLATVLIVGGIVALLAIVAYLMLGNRESERLTSTTLTAADTLSTQPETGPQAEQIDLPPAAAPETIRVAPVVPPTPVATPDTVGQPAVTSAPVAAAAAEPAAPSPATEEAAQSRIQGILNAYYEDMKAAPFAATSYFAPQVERFYTLQNTTPSAINEELTRSHFPEFLEAESQIEPGTLKVSPAVTDGSRVVTYTEKSRALRQSLQKRQQTTALVRVRFDKNFKIVYLRQEKLLENTFSE